MRRMQNHENRLTPQKLESKKQAKKVIAQRERFGWEVSIERLVSSHVQLIIRLQLLYYYEAF